jgi:hypothetical protein
MRCLPNAVLASMVVVAFVISCSTFSSTSSDAPTDAGAPDADAGATCAPIDGFASSFESIPPGFMPFTTPAGTIEATGSLHAHVKLSSTNSNEQAQISRAFSGPASSAELTFTLTVSRAPMVYVEEGCTLRIGDPPTDVVLQQVNDQLSFYVTGAPAPSTVTTLDVGGTIVVPVSVRATGLRGPTVKVSATLGTKTVNDLPSIDLPAGGTTNVGVLCGIDDASGGPATIDVSVDDVSFTLCP